MEIVITMDDIIKAVGICIGIVLAVIAYWRE